MYIVWNDNSSSKYIRGSPAAPICWHPLNGTQKQDLTLTISAKLYMWDESRVPFLNWITFNVVFKLVKRIWKLHIWNSKKKPNGPARIISKTWFRFENFNCKLWFVQIMTIEFAWFWGRISRRVFNHHSLIYRD